MCAALDQNTLAGTDLNCFPLGSHGQETCGTLATTKLFYLAREGENSHELAASDCDFPDSEKNCDDHRIRSVRRMHHRLHGGVVLVMKQQSSLGVVCAQNGCKR